MALNSFALCKTIKLSAAIVLFAATVCGADQVTIDSGVIEGATHSGIHTYKGIPYAAPPAGPLRWKPPQPVAHWTNVRPATSFGARCMQGRLFSDMIFRDKGPSENCLYLNVWTPAGSPSAHLPVMVWIYGGGFQAGSSSEPRQDGVNLAKKGVVVVSMNYRLGIFGFMALPALAKESEHNASGNYGLLDQLAALQWVNRNIQAFGGDPKNVTIFGESAGSFSVSAQVASPLAKGLFQRAIGESGSFFSTPQRPETTLAEAEQNGEKFASSIGTQSLDALRAIPGDELLKDALKQKDRGFSFWTDIDGYFMPKTMKEIYAAGEESHVPLLAGWNANEGGIGGGDPPATAQTWTSKAQQMFGDKSAEFLKLLPAKNDAEARQSADFFAAATFITLGTWQWIEAHQASSDSPVYRYLFEQAPPMKTGPSQGAYHSAEIEFVFNNLHAKDLPWTPQDYKLARMMSSYWTNFAKTGIPNGRGLPKWPPYSKDSDDLVMHLSGAKTVAKPANDAARFEFLEKNQPFMPETAER